MRWILGIAALVTALWCGYWFVGKTVIEKQAAAAIAQQIAAGKTIETTALYVSGFPNRFDLSVEGVNFADPARGTGWQTPFVQVFAMTWKPWHLIAGFADTQTLTLKGQVIQITSDGLMASVRAAPALDVPLAEARVAFAKMDLAAGWTLGLGETSLALRATPDVANSYDFGFETKGLIPDPQLIETLAALALPGLPASDLPPTVDRIHSAATVVLSAPLDRHAGTTKPRLISVDLQDLSLQWGQLGILAKGQIAPDDQGYAAGRIELTVTNWDRLPPLLVAAGLIKPEIAPTIVNLLGAMALDGGDGTKLTLPLTLKDGQMSFGPLPLGAAPRLVPPAG